MVFVSNTVKRFLSMNNHQHRQARRAILIREAQLGAFMIFQPSTERRQERDDMYTEKQGQYLAFIYYYTKIHGRSPSEADMQSYFGVTPPTVHQMVLSLERNGLIARTAGQARSIRLLLPRHELPDLE
jgi:DNA-binding MarR family transcriptional regulator